MRALAALAFVLAMSGLAGAAPQSKVLGPGEFLEVDLTLSAGQTVTWSARIDPAGERGVFNIHAHGPPPEREVQNLEAHILNGSETVSGTFVAPRDDLFSWLIDNALSRGQINATLDVEAGAPPAAGTPGIPAAGALAALGVACLAAQRWRRRPTAAVPPNGTA